MFYKACTNNAKCLLKGNNSDLPDEWSPILVKAWDKHSEEYGKHLAINRKSHGKLKKAEGGSKARYVFVVAF